MMTSMKKWTGNGAQRKFEHALLKDNNRSVGAGRFREEELADREPSGTAYQNRKQQTDQGEAIFEAGILHHAIRAFTKKEAVLAVDHRYGPTHDYDQRGG